MDAAFGQIAPPAADIDRRHTTRVDFEHICVVGHGQVHIDPPIAERMDLGRTNISEPAGPGGNGA